MSRTRIKALLLILAVLVSSAGSVGTAGQTHDRKNGSPDALKATEITYPVKTITTGMVAFLLTVDADGIVQNSQNSARYSTPYGSSTGSHEELDI